MDIQVDGGFVPSSLYELVAALPIIRQIGSVAFDLKCTNGALESWARRGLIPPPMLFGSRRAWLKSEVDLMSKRKELRGREHTGRLLLEQRIQTFSEWIGIVAACGDQFDSEYIAAIFNPRRDDGEELRGRGTFEGVCRRSSSAPVWHRLPYTYESSRHYSASLRHLTSGRSQNARLVRTVDVIAWNLEMQLAHSMHVRALLAA